MPASAHVITMINEAYINENIKAWFKQFNYLPPIPLTCGKIDTVPIANFSLEHLLELMIKSTFNNFILVIHGQPDGSGLYLPIFAKASKWSTFHYDLQKLMDVDAKVSEMSEADFHTMGFARLDNHTKAGLKQHNRKDPRLERVEKLLDLMRQARAKKIDCIEFRSCHLGKNLLALQRFRQFFGARLMGAPDLFTVFGKTDTKIGQNLLDTHKRHHPATDPATSKRIFSWETYYFPYALSNPRLVWCFPLNEWMKPEYGGGHIVADTTGTLDAWVKQYIMANGSASGNEMAIHCLWIGDIKVKPPPEGGPGHRPELIIADTKDPLGSWGEEHLGVRRPLPPCSVDYKNHIIYSR